MSSQNDLLDVDNILDQINITSDIPQEKLNQAVSTASDSVQPPADTHPQSERLQEDLKVSYPAKGYLEITGGGYGFLREDYESNPTADIYVSPSQMRRFWLRPGDLVEGKARAPKNGERYNSLLLIEKVNGKPVTEEDGKSRLSFDDLTSTYPDRMIKLEYDPNVLTTRLIDLISPIGFGQRALIVSQPKAGKTTFLKDIAKGLAANHPDVHVMAILIGERPEEVTEIKGFIKGEVAASNFDDDPRQQIKIANLALQRAKRLVETGKDVVILLDSITRLARAYNLAGPVDDFGNPLGRTNNNSRGGRQDRYSYTGRDSGSYGGGSSRGSMSGGMSQQALFPAKKFLGAARNCQEGGSLTIIGTALVGTESRMDDLIYEEFKGTGNMEIHLERKFAERRIYPAVDIPASGTRKEELLFDAETFRRITTLHRMLAMLTPEEAIVSMIDKLTKKKTNAEFLQELGK